jgi:transcriptional regulator with XRE-family HTH domain
LHVAQRCEHLLDTYRRPDGQRWTGQQLDEATGGVVPRSYVTNLRKGRIENPGYEKMRAIAKAMGFPPEAWFEEIPAGGARTAPEEGQNLAGRVQHLFDAVRHPKTGEPYTNAEVARMSAGGLTEEEVEGIRTGAISDPTLKQVAALAAAFGVEPSYLVDRREPPLLDSKLLEGLRDETTREITRHSLRLPEREREIVLGIVRQFGGRVATERLVCGVVAVGIAAPCRQPPRPRGRLRARWPLREHDSGFAGQVSHRASAIFSDSSSAIIQSRNGSRNAWETVVL